MKHAALSGMCFLVCLGGGKALSEDLPKPADDFYKKYPVYQEFFPFGVYCAAENAGWTSCNIHYMDEDRGYQFMLEHLRENYVNFEWGRVPIEERHGRYVLQDKARMKLKWQKKLDMYSLITLSHWFAAKGAYGLAMKQVGGKDKWLTDKELDKIIETHRPKFEAIRMLRKELGDRLLGIVNDDEPAGVPQSYLSSLRVIKRFIPDLPVTTVTGPSPRTEPFLPYMELLCSESYGHSKWNTRDLFLKYYRHSPRIVLWNDILTGSYGIEPTLPDLRDSKPTQGEVRLAYWQSVAGGAKGFFCYLFRMLPPWWKGDESFFNQFGRQLKNDTLSVMHDVGRELTAIGPVLLSCHPVENDIKKIRFRTRAVDYLQFQGPALDCGVLQDKENKGLRYIVVYNNNIDANEKGAMTLPGAWLAGRTLFDLHALARVAATDGKATFPVTELRPGEGRIYLVADQGGFQRCKRRILTHRVRNDLIRLDIRVRELRPLVEKGWSLRRFRKTLTETFPEILQGQAEIRKALASPSADMEKTYKQLLDLIAKADKARHRDHLGTCNRYFKALEDVVAELDETIDCFSQELFGVAPERLTLHRCTRMKNTPLFYQYLDLIVKYFAAKNAYWRGVFGSYMAGGDLPFRLGNYIREARELLATYRKTVQDALARSRQPIKVLFITPDRTHLESIETYAWLYKSFPATYGQVKPDGSVVDRKGKRRSIEEFDVLWFHALRTYRDLPKEGIRAAHVLQPVFLRKPFIDQVKAHLGKDKSLMLTGLFAMYALPLGLEDTPPNVVLDQFSPNVPMLRGFVARPGFAGHPVFRGDNAAAPLAGTTDYVKLARHFPRGKGTGLRLNPAGFYTNGHYHKSAYFAECTWRNAKALKGRVVAEVYDSTLGALAGYAGIIEYGGGGRGQGKVLVAGAMPFDFSPGPSWNPLFSPRFKGFIRSLAYNMLCYLGGKETFAMDREAAARVKRQKKTFHFLPTVWKFRLDPDNKGVGKGWFRKDFDDSRWDDIQIGASWESRGYQYDGYAWYRVTFKVPEALKGKKVVLHFGAVDEIGYVYLDGQYLGKGGASPHEDQMGWATPFHFDITDKITDFTRGYQLTVRVHDSLAAGGVWKPVYLDATK